MATQKINTPAPGLYPKTDFVKVVPTTEPKGLYFALRYLYADDKDVNDWYFTLKNKDKCEAGWKDILPNFDPWRTDFRNGNK